MPLTYSPYLPGLVSPLLQGSDQTAAVLQQSPPPLQHQAPQPIQQQPAKQRNDRIEVRVRPINLLSSTDTQAKLQIEEQKKKIWVKVTILASFNFVPRETVLKLRK